jgi:hypothetical protein
MLKPEHSLLVTDPRSQRMTIDDLHSMVRGIVLTETVPVAIREQFDTAERLRLCVVRIRMHDARRAALLRSGRRNQADQEDT